MDLLEQKRTETLINLFEDEGWKIFIDEQEELLAYAKENAHRECVTNDEWQFRKGVITLLERVVSFETVVRAVQDQAEQEDNNDSEDF